MATTKSLMDRKLVVGSIFIGIGILVLLNQLDFFSFNINQYIFNWRNLLIAIGIIVMTNPDNRATGLVLTGIGVLFWLPAIFDFHIEFRKIIGPIILIAIGLLLIAQKNQPKNHLGPHHRHPNNPNPDTQNEPKSDSNAETVDYEIINDDNSTNSNKENNYFHQENVRPQDYIDESAVFSSNATKIISDTFIGGRITAIFGGIDLDMRNVKISPRGAIIDCFTFCGGTDIIIPDDWSVKSEITSILGGYTDNRIIRGNSTDPNKTLILKGSTICGGIELKSF